MNDDGSLLKLYVTDNSQSAFAELVQRHLGLVYSVALRNLSGDTHRAQDVTQKVFGELARKAKSLCDRESVAGWLHICARHSAMALKRSEARRDVREKKSLPMNENLQDGPNWETIAPVIDTMLVELPPNDREIILLRFFERHSFAHIGSLLNLSEDAAQKRAARALEKMRDRFAKQGVTSSAFALGSTLAAHAAPTGPIGFSAFTVANAATSAAGGTALLASAFMTTKSTLLVGSALALAGLGLVWQHREQTKLTGKTESSSSTELNFPAAQSDLHVAPANPDPPSSSSAANAPIAEARTRTLVDPPSSTNAMLRAAVSPLKDSPRSAAATVRTAIDGGDAKTLSEIITLETAGHQIAEEAFNQLSLDQKAKFGSPPAMMAELLCATTPGASPGSQILSEELPGARGLGAEFNDDPSYRTLHTRTQSENGKIRDTVQVFHQTEDGWRWVVTKGLVTKRLAETGLIPPPAK